MDEFFESLPEARLANWNVQQCSPLKAVATRSTSEVKTTSDKDLGQAPR